MRAIQNQGGYVGRRRERDIQLDPRDASGCWAQRSGSSRGLDEYDTHGVDRRQRGKVGGRGKRLVPLDREVWMTAVVCVVIDMSRVG